MAKINNDVQVLRAIAVLVVVAGHLLSQPIFQGIELVHKIPTYLWLGNGVDLFFVISGYVIALTLIPLQQEAIGKGWIYVAQVTAGFWIRRAYRIWPTAWLWLGMTLVATLFFNSHGSFGLFRDNYKDAIAAMAQVLNFKHIYQSDMLSNPESMAIGVYWSLSLEEQFYLILPFVGLLAKKWIFRILSLCIAIYLFLPVVPDGHGILWNFRILPIILGVVLAMLRYSPIYLMFEPAFLSSGKIKKSLLTFFLVMFGAAIVAVDVVRFGYFIMAITCMILVFIASFDQGYTLNKGILRTFFLWVGSRSYAIYLTHAFVLILTNEILFKSEIHGIPFNGYVMMYFVALVVGLTMAFSELNYRIIEGPMRKKGKLIADTISLKAISDGK